MESRFYLVSFTVLLELYNPGIKLQATGRPVVTKHPLRQAEPLARAYPYKQAVEVPSIPREL